MKKKQTWVEWLESKIMSCTCEKIETERGYKYKPTEYQLTITAKEWDAIKNSGS
jgi:hypothetical protein